MAKVISVINQKGGVGKTTTVSALAAGLMMKGYKTLLIDLDGQCNLSYSLGAEREALSSMDVLTGAASIEQAIQPIKINMDIVPASMQLASADIQIVEIGKEYRLREAIDTIKTKYDYIIIDTPPTLGILTINALTASDIAIVPAQADAFSLEAIIQLYATVSTVTRYTNSELQVAGVLITRYNDRAVLSRDMKQVISEEVKRLGSKVFDATIREGVAIKESQLCNVDLFSYAPKSNVADDYRKFIEEFLKDNAI